MQVDDPEKMTQEQEQALDALIKRIPNRPVETVDAWETWLGIPKKEVTAFIGSLLGQKDVLEKKLLDRLERQPLDSVFEFLAATSLAFYYAEKGVNPKIKTVMDAFYYISTCASVGYADIFAATQTGRAIASLVMIVGPAMTSRSLNRPEKRD